MTFSQEHVTLPASHHPNKRHNRAKTEHVLVFVFRICVLVFTVFLRVSLQFWHVRQTADDCATWTEHAEGRRETRAPTSTGHLLGTVSQPDGTHSATFPHTLRVASYTKRKDAFTIFGSRPQVELQNISNTDVVALMYFYSMPNGNVLKTLLYSIMF